MLIYSKSFKGEGILRKRLSRIRDIISTVKADGIIIYSPENRRYLSGFTGSTGYVIISKEKKSFITDFRYTKQASMECQDFEIIESKTPLENYLTDTIKKHGIEALAYEDSFMTIDFYDKLKGKLKNVKLIPLREAQGKIRIIKDDKELEYIKKAAEIADGGFQHIIGFIKAGMSEKHIGLELEFFMRKNGAFGLSFESIVASGWRSSLPHGVATDKIVEEGDFLTLDFGCVYNGYCSDMTRTLVIGKADDRQKKIYNTVLKAQKEAMKHIKVGAICKDIDRAARDIIKDAGFQNYFGHGLGHGVGLAVHEEPRLSPTGETILEANMVVTNEPGIYIPDYGGVRIEDLIIVRDDKPEIISKSTKELIEL